MVDIKLPFRTIEFKEGQLILLDQRQLPRKLEYVAFRRYTDVIQAIRNLTVRGAPAIGVAAGYAMVLASIEFCSMPGDQYLQLMSIAAGELIRARPTAVNLRWAVERIQKTIEGHRESPVSLIHQLVAQEAENIETEDWGLCRAIGENGASLIRDGDGILTHCNAGALATAGIGTALGVIYYAAFTGKIFKIYAGETRPVDQGKRLTLWELSAVGLDVTLLCDSMVASLASSGRINKIIVGADRIAMNGDTANKIGTLSIALIANHYHIPFYVAAPYSTIDIKALSGLDVPIEFRPKEEVALLNDYVAARGKIEIYNPAFDITPASMVTAYITDKGILRPADIGKVFQN